MAACPAVGGQQKNELSSVFGGFLSYNVMSRLFLKLFFKNLSLLVFILFTYSFLSPFTLQIPCVCIIASCLVFLWGS